MKLKRCSHCNNELSLDKFGWNNKLRNKKHSWCKECHKIYSKKHYQDNICRYYPMKVARKKQRRIEVRLFLFNYFKTHPCIECNETNPILLDFDHVDPKTKIHTISHWTKYGTLSKIKLEIPKCVVRCVRCHRLRTAKQYNWYADVAKLADAAALEAAEKSCGCKSLHPHQI